MISRPPLHAAFVLFLLGAPAMAPAATVSAAAVSSDLPRPPDGLLDPTGRMTHEATAAFRRVAEHVRRDTGGELAAAVVGSLDGKDPSDFARELSESWRLGGDEARGALILVALEDRQVQIALGRGLDDPERREHAAEIVRGTLAPRLRQGDVGGAIAAAAQECATRIFYVVQVIEPEDPGRPTSERHVGAEGEGGRPTPAVEPPRTRHDPRRWSWVPCAIGVAVLLLGLALYGAFRAERR